MPLELALLFAFLLFSLLLLLFICRRLANEKEHWRQRHDQLLGEFNTQKATSTLQQAVHEERLILLKNVEKEWQERFRLVSAETLQNSQRSFLDLAHATLEKFHEKAKAEWEKKEETMHTTMAPVKEALHRFDHKLQELEKVRVGAYATLMQQIQTMAEGQLSLRTETAHLINALRAPTTRGRWGEIQLRRVVEMAGMVEHCDFIEQMTVTKEEARQRPDVVVQLPGKKQIVIDAKTPLSAYLESLETVDEEKRKEKLQEHAKQLRSHIQWLSRKSYWEQFQPAPEFVILFLPGETFFNAALEQDPSLIEMGVEQKVLLATPTTLIAILRAVAYGWRQSHLSETAEKMGSYGRDLYKRLADLADHWQKLGKSLTQAVHSYNKAVGSLEARVLVAARRFNDLDAMRHSDQIEAPLLVDEMPRPLNAPEMVRTDEKM